jgi:outer membrane lipase/esterase
VLQTDRPDPDYIVWSAGVSAQFINGISGFANYQSTAGYDNLTLTDLTYGLRWERTF